ncbi:MULTISPECIES: HEPN domain-containing protein [unclassified Nocardioides]|uniref:HEPN domain-containing protein n=1 Tax=unclassified Nocardioides TaxID=2615069 RepID=UPI000A26C01B|nr:MULTISPECIES: HEPN domain-containing protein [unclassified Nocardioides]
MSDTEPDTPTVTPSPDQAWALPPMPEDVIDPQLFKLTMTVVAQMDAMVTEYFAREGYKYTPYRDKRQVKAFDSGWPNVYSKEKDETRVAPADLFAHKASVIDPFPYDDIPGVAALKEYVTSTPSVLQRMRPENEAGTLPDDLAESFMDTSIVLFPNSIYDRATALGLEITDPAVADLYAQRERSWLAPTLEYQLVVPLLLTDFDISDEGLQVDDETRIERLTDDDLRCISEVDRFTVMAPLADAAKWAVVVDMAAMENIGEGRTLFSRDAPIDTRGVEAVCDAIRIVSLARPGWARVFRRPRNWARHWEDNLPNLNHVFTARRYPSYFEDGGWLKEHAGVTANEAAQLPVVAAALKTSSAQAKLASRRLSTALLRDTPDDQLIDACIGLEALLGQKGAEISYRVAVRAAALLATKAEEPRAPELTFKLARKVYDRRSELVHGSTSGKHAMVQPQEGGHEFSTHSVAVWLLREVLLERLVRSDWSVEDLDAMVLQGLAPANPADPGADTEEAQASATDETTIGDA